MSSPRGLQALDVGREQELLDRALSRLTGEGLAQVVWAPSATWADLQDMLLSESWHVMHFIGHGDFHHDWDEGVLALTDANGHVDLVEASRLVDLLRQARPMPGLVVLNSCSGAAVGVTDLFSGTAAALVRGGVSAVAAMPYEISDPAAVAFARGFYGAITHGRGVDDAVSSGRVAIVGLSRRTLEWITPVLYLRGNDTHLFTVPASPSLVSSVIRRQEEDATQDPPLAARPQALSAKENELREHAEVKTALLEEAGRLVPVTDVRAARRALRSIQERWELAGPVPREAHDRLEQGLRRVEEAVRKAEDAQWRRSNPEALARAQGTVEQLRTTIASLEQQLAKAKQRGDMRVAVQATEAITARRSWLEEAERTLAELSGSG